MLSFHRRRDEAALIERYWLSLRRNPRALAPDALDHALAAVIAEADRELRPPRLSHASIEQIWRRVEDRAPQAQRSAWSGPVINPTTRRRASLPPRHDSEEQQHMSDRTRATDADPYPIQQRPWLRETLKLAAVALVFIVIGAILALTLRGDDNEPTLGPSGPASTPTPTATVDATATTAAVVPEPTSPASPTDPTSAPATATAQPSQPATLPSFGVVSASIPVGRAPRNMAAGEGALWVANASDGTVSRIDPGTNEVVATIQVVPAGDLAVDAIAVGGGSVWVTSQGSLQLARIDPATNQVVATASLGVSVHELVYGGGALWGRATFSNAVVRIDPATNSVVATIDVAPPPFSIVYLDDALWSLGESEIAKIDPATNTVVATVPVTALGREIVVAGGSLWHVESPGPELVQVDPSSATVVARHALPEVLTDAIITASDDAIYICACVVEDEAMIWRFDLGAREVTAALDPPATQWIAYMGGALWSVSQADGVITRIDVEAPATTAQPELPEIGTVVAGIEAGHNPRQFATGEGSLWVTNADDGTVSRIDLATNELVATIVVVPPDEFITGVHGALQVDAIAAGDGSIWVSAANRSTLARIDPLTNEVVERVPLPVGVHGLTFGGGALWGRSWTGNQIVRIDPATGAVVASIPVEFPASAVYLADALWVQHPGEVVKIDPATNTVVASVTYADAPGDPSAPRRAMVEAGGSLWVASDGWSEILEIDPATASIVGSVALPFAIETIVIAGGQDAVWVCPCFGNPDEQVWQLDPATREWNAVQTVPLVVAINSDGLALWGIDSSGQLVHVIPAP